MSDERTDLVGEFQRLLAPRIATLVTALRDDGRPNTMVVAWHTPISINPPILAVAISPSRTSHGLILKSEEFTVSIPDESLIKKVLVAGSKSGSSFDKSNLFEYQRGQKIGTPVIVGALGNIECTLNRVIEMGDHSVFFGNVVAASARFFKGTWLNVSPLLYLGDNHFTLIGKNID